MKCLMNRNQLSLCVLLLVACSLASCSGLPKKSSGGGGGGGGGGTGTKTLTVTLIAAPESVQQSFTLLAFSAQISSLVLNEAAGGTIPLTLSPSPYPVDFNRLTTDTAVLSVDKIPTNTQFSSITMAVQNIAVTIANGASPIGSTCAANAVCQFTAAPSVASVTATLLPGMLTPGSDGNTNIYLTASGQDLVMGNSAGLTVNFAGSGFNTVGSFFLPRKGTPGAAGVDLVQDFTGVVTAVSATSVTVTTGSGVALTAALTSSTTLDVPQSTLCTAKTVAACVTKGAVVSMDASVASGGALTALEIDLLDPTAVDSVEGTIYSPVAGSFSLVVTDKQVVSGNATLTTANIGDIFALTLDPAATYVVDTKNLTTASPIVPTTSFQSSADILSGQTVRLHVTAATGAKSTTNQALSANQVQLRFARVTATASPSATSLVGIVSLNQIFRPTATTVQVQTYTGITTYDNGITSNADIGGVGSSNLVSIRALFLKGQPSFFATTIRDQ
jgi:hypothetical protein